MAADEPVDAVFCGDDWIALGAQAALRAAGLRVPDDVAIIGFDNIGRLVDRAATTLTTIDPGLAELGAAAAAHLVGAIHGDPVVTGVQFQPCTLFEGTSTVGGSTAGHSFSVLADL